MKNFDNKALLIIGMIIGFFSGIAFVNNWLILNKGFPNVGLFKVPFEASIWGNVSDWAIFFITAFTAIYLVKTFREQRVITQLEQRRFLDSYLPILEVNDIIYNNLKSHSETKFDVIIRSNALQNLEISHNFPDYIDIEIPYIVKNVMLAKEKKLSFCIIMKLSPVFIEIKQYSGHTIIFQYQDYLGHKYKQHLFFLGSDNVYMQPAFRIDN